MHGKSGNNIIRTSYHGRESDFTPVRIIETEIGHPLPDIGAFNEKTNQRYQRAFCLIRLHTQPLGIIELHVGDQGLSASEYARQIWDALHIPIVKHLQDDGLPTVGGLSIEGLPDILCAPCFEERESLLQTAPMVSIIVATRDRPADLARCLHSLMALHYPRYEVIVVDNAPATTATADLIQQMYSNEPRLKYAHENRPGLSYARNCGIRVAKGEILAFTDDDVVVDACWLVGLVKAFKVANGVACVTGLVLPLELETRSQTWFEEFGGFNKGFTQRIFDRTGGHADIPLYPFAAGQFGTGANMAFTAAFLKSIGGFDPALGTGTLTGGGEDLSAFFQVIASGNRLVYEPASLLYHLHRRDYAQLQRQIYYYGVGLIAFLTKIVFDDPLRLLDLIARTPYGLFFILSSRSSKNKKQSQDYPKDLVLLERKGMLYGPFAYLRSRWQAHKISQEITVLDETRAIKLIEG